MTYIHPINPCIKQRFSRLKKPVNSRFWNYVIQRQDALVKRELSIIMKSSIIRSRFTVFRLPDYPKDKEFHVWYYCSDNDGFEHVSLSLIHRFQYCESESETETVGKCLIWSPILCTDGCWFFWLWLAGKKSAPLKKHRIFHWLLMVWFIVSIDLYLSKEKNSRFYHPQELCHTDFFWTQIQRLDCSLTMRFVTIPKW